MPSGPSPPDLPTHENQSPPALRAAPGLEAIATRLGDVSAVLEDVCGLLGAGSITAFALTALCAPMANFLATGFLADAVIRSEAEWFAASLERATA
jgi:hypothetical protein